MKLILRWIISAAAVWAAVRLVPGLRLEGGYTPLFLVAFILGFVNAIIRPILKFLACGLIFLTLGLFLLIINAVMLLLTASIARFWGIEFYVDSFTAALLGSLVISLVSYVASMLLLPESEKE
jgi:putative membrane protein